MSKSFNLLDTPWVPVRYLDGHTADVGLKALFADADRIAALAETEPPSLITLYRLLLAITHRAFALRFERWGSKDLARCYREGLPLDAIDAYLERWREHFWLFHPEHPFMQVPALAQAEATRDKIKPWTQIALAAANGSAPVLFDHSLDTRTTSLPAAPALRKLLGFLQFTPGGLVKVLRDSDKAGPLADTAAVLPQARTLAQTLCLALHPAGHDDDPPAWEKPAPTIADLLAPPTPVSGPNDRYTRLTRAVLLIPEGDGSVARIHFAAGLAIADDDNAPDPLASYRAGSNGLVRLSFTEGRAVWRDLATLLPDASGRQAQPAAVLNWAGALSSRLDPDGSELPTLVAGLASNQAKLLRWRAERLLLPTALLTDADAAGQLRDLMRAAEALFADLRGLATAMIADTMPDSGHKDTRSHARSMVDNGAAAASFFSSLERALPRLLALSAGRQFDTAQRHWNGAQQEAARLAWSAVGKQLGDSVAALRARARAEPRLQALLRPLHTSSSPSDKETPV